MRQAEPSLPTGPGVLDHGGAHHTVRSDEVTAAQPKDGAAMRRIEFVHITRDMTVESQEATAFHNDLVWKLK